MVIFSYLSLEYCSKSQIQLYGDIKGTERIEKLASVPCIPEKKDTDN